MDAQRGNNILTTLHKEFLLDHWTLCVKGEAVALYDRSTGNSICIAEDRIFLLIADVETGSTPVDLTWENVQIHNMILWMCRENRVHINKYLSRAIHRAMLGNGENTKSPKRVDDRLLGAAMATTNQAHYHFYQTAREFYKRQLALEGDQT